MPHSGDMINREWSPLIMVFEVFEVEVFELSLFGIAMGLKVMNIAQNLKPEIDEKPEKTIPGINYYSET